MRGHSAKDKKGIGRWWNTISHHPLWAALIATLLAGGIAAHSGGVFGGGAPDAHSAARKSRNTKNQTRLLRVAFDQVAPGIYSVAFGNPISLPNPSEDWASLHRRGGVDVGESNFRLTLANQTAAPLTVTNIEAVVDGSAPAPTGALASVYTQGASLLEEFGVELTSDAIGTTAQFHRQEPTETSAGSPSVAPAFFHSHYIRVPPHDLYEAKVSVVSTVDRRVEYGFVVTGDSARGSFSYRLAPRFTIAQYAQKARTKFVHSYWWLPHALGGPCWIAPYEPTNGKEPRCP